MRRDQNSGVVTNLGGGAHDAAESKLAPCGRLQEEEVEDEEETDAQKLLFQDDECS